MVNLREQAVLKAAQEIWNRTGRPVSADAIAQAAGFDDETTQQVPSALTRRGAHQREQIDLLIALFSERKPMTSPGNPLR
jgi:hypothetical protein